MLAEHKDAWARLPVTAKVDHLRTLARATAENAQSVGASGLSRPRGSTPTSSLAGEEWSSGPWALLFGVNRLIETLSDVARYGPAALAPGQRPHASRTARWWSTSSPRRGWDRLLLSGVSAQVWMQRGVTEANLADTMAVFYRQSHPSGAVALVLGAGNIASIPPLDVLYKMFAEGRVCLLKMNPVNEYLGPVFEEIFARLARCGFIRFAYGGSEVGEYLTTS